MEGGREGGREGGGEGVCAGLRACELAMCSLRAHRTAITHQAREQLGNIPPVDTANCDVTLAQYRPARGPVVVEAAGPDNRITGTALAQRLLALSLDVQDAQRVEPDDGNVCRAGIPAPGENRAVNT